MRFLLLFAVVWIGAVMFTSGEYNGGSILVGVGFRFIVFRQVVARIARSMLGKWIVGALSTIFGLVIVLIIEPSIDVIPAQTVRQGIFQALTIGSWVVALSCFLDLHWWAEKELES